MQNFSQKKKKREQVKTSTIDVVLLTNFSLSPRQAQTLHVRRSAQWIERKLQFVFEGEGKKN